MCPILIFLEVTNVNINNNPELSISKYALTHFMNPIFSDISKILYTESNIITSRFMTTVISFEDGQRKWAWFLIIKYPKLTKSISNYWHCTCIKLTLPLLVSQMMEIQHHTSTYSYCHKRKTRCHCKANERFVSKITETTNKQKWRKMITQVSNYIVYEWYI